MRLASARSTRSEVWRLESALRSALEQVNIVSAPIPGRRRTSTMTSSQIIQRQRLNAKIEEARQASDISRLQHLLGEMTAFLASIYGRRKENAGP